MEVMRTIMLDVDVSTFGLINQRMQDQFLDIAGDFYHFIYSPLAIVVCKDELPRDYGIQVFFQSQSTCRDYGDTCKNWAESGYCRARWGDSMSTECVTKPFGNIKDDCVDACNNCCTYICANKTVSNGEFQGLNSMLNKSSSA